MEVEFQIIVAVDNNHGIGNDNNQIPWRIPKDLQLFSKFTKHHVVVMGRKTWDSIPSKFKPLPNRINIVISRQERPNDIPNNVLWWNDLFSKENQDILRKFKQESRMIYLIGGSRLLFSVMNSKELCSRCFFHEIDRNYNCSVVIADDYWKINTNRRIWYKNELLDKNINEKVSYKQVMYSNKSLINYLITVNVDTKEGIFEISQNTKWKDILIFVKRLNPNYDFRNCDISNFLEGVKENDNLYYRLYEGKTLRF